MFMSQSSHLVDAVVDYFDWRHGEQIPPRPVEPEQTYILGGKYADYALAFVFALAFPLLRMVLRTLVYAPTAKIFLPKAKGSSKADPEAIRKWCESCWKMTVYIIFTSLAFLVSYKEVWFYDTRYLWLGCTHFPPCNLYVNHKVLLFYCVQTGFYLQAIHFLAFLEVRRKDWLESMIHHIVTVGLLVYSYYVNFTRVGILIMLLHDISDIFLEAAKLCRYSRSMLAANTFFGVFFVSWIIARMVYFPLVVIRSCLTEPITLIGRPFQIEPMPHYAIFNGLLIVLLILHTYWSWLIFQVLLTAIKTSGRSGDVREGDVDDKDD